MEPVTVSVVIPAHNRSGTIARAIGSALAQTHPPAEVIVVDDASTDGTSDVVTAVTDRRVRLLRRSARGGPATARNDGIDSATGEFVAFLDSDDAWHHDKLRRQLAVARAATGRVGLVLCGYRAHTPRGLRHGLPAPARAGSGSYLAMRSGRTVTSCFLVPRRVVDAGARFDDSLPALEDYEFALAVNRRFDVVVVRRSLVDKYDSGPAATYSAPAAAQGRERIIAKYAEALATAPAAHRRHLLLLADSYAAAGRAADAEGAVRAAARVPAGTPLSAALGLVWDRSPAVAVALARAAVRLDRTMLPRTAMRLLDQIDSRPSAAAIDRAGSR